MTAFIMVAVYLGLTCIISLTNKIGRAAQGILSWRRTVCLPVRLSRCSSVN